MLQHLSTESIESEQLTVNGLYKLMKKVLLQYDDEDLTCT